MRTIGLAALIGFGFAAPAMADGVLPEEYQGVWAAAGDCKANLQNARATDITRRSAACRVTRVVSSGPPESRTSNIDLNCAGARSREIWHAETIDGADYLVTVQFAGGAGAAKTSIDVYKRCAGIPLDEIPLSEIPGNPVAEAGPETKIAPPARRVQTVRQRPHPHARGARVRKRSPQ